MFKGTFDWMKYKTELVNGAFIEIKLQPVIASDGKPKR